MLRLVSLALLALLASLVAATSAAAKPRDNLFVYRVTAADLTANVQATFLGPERTYDPGEEGTVKPRETASLQASATMSVRYPKRRSVRRSGAAFFGWPTKHSSSYGPHGVISGKRRPFPWAGAGRYDGVSGDWEDGRRRYDSGDCRLSGKTTEGAKPSASIKLLKGDRAQVSIGVPDPPDMECGGASTDLIWGGRDGTSAVTVIPAQRFRQRTLTIPFAASFTETEEYLGGERKATVTYRGSVTIEYAHSCRTPPEFPCHTYLIS